MVSFLFFFFFSSFPILQDEDGKPEHIKMERQKKLNRDRKRVFLTAQAHLHQQVPIPSKPLPSPPYPSINQLARYSIHNRRQDPQKSKLHTCFPFNCSSSTVWRWCNRLNRLIFSWSSRRTSFSSLADVSSAFVSCALARLASELGFGGVCRAWAWWGLAYHTRLHHFGYLVGEIWLDLNGGFVCSFVFGLLFCPRCGLVGLRVWYRVWVGGPCVAMRWVDICSWEGICIVYYIYRV